jgi:hypothetical protein
LGGCKTLPYLILTTGYWFPGFVLAIWDFGGRHSHWGDGAMMPRHIRYIDKRNLVAIMNPSYFGKLLNLPIDKIDIIVLK